MLFGSIKLPTNVKLHSFGESYLSFLLTSTLSDWLIYSLYWSGFSACIFDTYCFICGKLRISSIDALKTVFFCKSISNNLWNIGS